MTSRDTIFALSTPSGRGAISVIRVSGPQSRVILETLVGDSPDPRRFCVRRIKDPESQEVIDQAVVVWLPGPQSYTGEDSAEFHLHASAAVQRAMLGVLAQFSEVRPAEPGEFTQRAVLNGKLDLVEAEGLADLIDAQTVRQRQQALSQLLGHASTVFDSWRERLLLIRADIEAAVDFSDEPGVAEEACARIDAQVSRLVEEMEREVARSRNAEIVKAGVRVVLAGLPNTGKSSLLNALARRDAAIVSEIPGTTRDVIEVHIELEGLAVILTDTAGLRDDVTDIVEAEGVRRTRSRLSAADVVVWVASPDVDGSYEYDRAASPNVIVSAKMDLSDQESGLLRNEVSGLLVFPVSTRTGDGIPGLVARISQLVRREAGDHNALIASARQKQATLDSVGALMDCLGIPKEALELKAEALRRASDAIGRLTGRIEVEEWLGAIFSRFCIGK